MITRKINLTLLVLFLSLNLTAAQEVEETISYKTAFHLPYYEGTDQSEYMRERCKLDLYYPDNLEEGFPTLVWFHGGGLKAGEKYIPEYLKNQGMAIATVNYRLYPRIKCPVYIEDAAAAVAWIFKNIEKYGGDPDLIFVSGHSAGGYLASMIGLDKQWLEKHNIDANRIAGLLPVSGHTITHFTVREEQGITGEKPTIDAYAPLSHMRDDAPPLVLITGDRNLELLARYEENAYMYQMMKLIGHKETTLLELQGFNHGEVVVPAYGIIKKEMSRISKKMKEN